ncbi:hypothetical protein [Streptomyces sp. AB3(2024)]|uniref:hypothetical protein n=1 Tax=Streptomyces sp. AB3(2024) TaxID=3317321 RepID=UPI0035A2C7D4
MEGDQSTRPAGTAPGVSSPPTRGRLVAFVLLVAGGVLTAVVPPFVPPDDAGRRAARGPARAARRALTRERQNLLAVMSTLGEESLVLDKGRIVETGTHTSLLHGRGRYAALVHAGPPTEGNRRRGIPPFAPTVVRGPPRGRGGAALRW